MSFAAEPYAIFVDDLVRSMTGGIARESFVFLPENMPFRLAARTDVLAGTVRAHGLAGGAFTPFVDGRDFTVSDGTLSWKAGPDGGRAADATWPDRGSTFWVGYERIPDPQAPPRLTDRNPGSVLRILAESFAREFAVVSRQLEAVYRAGFLETAAGRDLDQLAALVGVTRRTRTFNTGEVVFSRTSPAPGDIFIPEGALVSTSDVPAVSVETTDDATLRRGTLSVAVPVRALVAGLAGAAAAGTLTVLHRPIVGITAVTNPQPLSPGSTETDEALRRRAARALETGGRSTVGAIVGALTAVEGIREQDVLVVEDHVATPGVVKLTIAADLDAATQREAVDLIERYRPAGVRVLHNLPVTATATITPGPGGGGGGPGPPAPTPPGGTGNRFPVGVRVAVTPASAQLTDTEKQSLVAAVGEVVEATVENAGVGETLIYNRLVAAIMGVEGVYDAVVDLYKHSATVPAPPSAKFNLAPSPPDTRPQLDQLDVTLRGAVIALDITVRIERLLELAMEERETALSTARQHILSLLLPELAAMPRIDTARLTGLLPSEPPDTPPTYVVADLSYQAEFVDEGLVVRRANVTIEPQGDQQVIIRTLTVQEASQVEAVGGGS